MIKSCVVCGKNFNALRSARCCSAECSVTNQAKSTSKWAAEHPEQMRALCYKWAANNPEKMREAREKHAGKKNENARKHYAANREEEHQEGRDYYAANSVEILRKMRRCYAAHPDVFAERIRKYGATERGKASAVVRRQNRRTMLRGIPMALETVMELKSEFLGFCPYCWDKIEKGHVDHIVPASKGGTNDRMNLVWVCSTCNRQKHDRSLPEFRLYQEEMAMKCL